MAKFPLSAYRSGAGVGLVAFTTSLGAVVALVPTGGGVVIFASIAVVDKVVAAVPVVGGADEMFIPEVVGVGVGVAVGFGVGVGTGVVVAPEIPVAIVGDVTLGAAVGGIVVALTAADMFTASTWMSITNFPASSLPPPWIVNSVLTRKRKKERKRLLY